MTDNLNQLKIDRSAVRRRRAPYRGWLIAALLLVLVGTALWWHRRSAPVSVETTSVSTAYPYQALAVLNATGYVVANRKAAVGSKATGRLEWLGVQEGSTAKQGEVIARLESRDVSAQADQARANVGVAKAAINQARAELVDASAAFRRAQELAQKQFIAPAQVDSAAARHRRAQAAVASAEAAATAAEANFRAAQVAFEQTNIRAPFDGTVLTKNANVGDNITPFSAAADTKGAVVTMADMSTLEVEADVSESSLAKISPGGACEIQFDAFPELRLRGEVSRIVPTVDRAKASVLTKVKFIERDPRVLPDMSVKVAFLSRPAAADDVRARVVVHAAALVERDGGAGVFAVENGTARYVRVSPGARIDELVELAGDAGGLKPGDKVVMRADAGLRDGQAVTAAKK
ncbi:MAG: efflux RND transporter periplasmic adaptor subunit [Rhodocyclaceae bacterium]|nr:efflux RND transporter periplasmic adaptor subunit [Rhodocyclaceae bacterium]MBX3671143.1 efflux RND transporter periplasmic adaptor subunit [Rhodocyclaceae bacterium]